MTRKFWSAFVATTVLAGLGTFGFTAHAFQRRQHAMFCKPDPAQPSSQGTWSLTSGQYRWTSTAGVGGLLLCPLLDDDSAPIKTLAWISIQGYDANPDSSDIISTQLSATPCITYEAGLAGGSCDSAHKSTSGTTFTGAVDMLIDRTLFGSKGTFDFPYVSVTVPSTFQNGLSSLWGLNWAT